MKRKELFQSLISIMQEELLFPVKARDLQLPIESGQIIAVTGVRRCGKSFMMKIAADKLIESGIDRKRILWINFDDERLEGMPPEELDEILTAYREMYPEIPLKEVFMFFDEIQNVDKWELFIMRVYKTYCKNIFISGSNSKMLSSQIATSLRGWPLEYMVYPLSFGEYIRFKEITANEFSEQGKAKLNSAFKNYLFESSFPEVALLEERSMKIRKIQGYFNTMLLRDLAEINGISSVETLRYFLKRIMLNLGKPTSINKIYNDIKSQGKKTDKNRLYEYIDHACNIFLFIKVSRWSKSMIEENNFSPKYYIIDNGMLNAVMLPQSDDVGKLFENAVLLQLKRTITPDGKIYYFNEGMECDFVIQEEHSVTRLIQVSWDITSDETLQRELRGLKAASNMTGCNECYLINSDRSEIIEYKGLKVHLVQAWKWFFKGTL